jgi:aspartate/methionine/tyrosine aminotransferase
VTPEATFYVWLDVEDDEAFARELYRAYNLKVLPGSYLGRYGGGAGYVRLALVYDETRMRDALTRIAQYVQQKETR